MAPSTTLGAATPVQVGGLPAGADETEGDGNAMSRKLANDAVAFIRGLARQHGRNAEWAERAVREAATLTAEEAVELGVVDLVAEDLGALLDAVDGREVETFAGARRLATADAEVERLAPDWRIRLLSVITDPTVAYVLLLVGIYGLIFELSSPGAVLPGVVGVIALLLALYAFQVLPINYAGLALMLVGVAFMVAEAFVPSFGALGLGGVLAFVAGSLILLEEDQLAVSLPVIGGTALVSAGFFAWVLTRFVRLRRERARTGREELLGMRGEVLEPLQAGGRGWVRVHGERWRARSARPLRRGARVRVKAVDGLWLEVEPVDETEPQEVQS
jgi:membrane-bound serine protease (ClpP class)